MKAPRREGGVVSGVALMIPLLALAGCQGASADTEAAAVARGREVYHEQFCGTCHTLASAETAGAFGPTHDGIATRAEERIRDPAYRGSATTAAEYLRESIVEPAAFRAPGFGRTRFAMPSYSQLPPEDIEGLVQMLLRERDRD